MRASPLLWPHPIGSARRIRTSTLRFQARQIRDRWSHFPSQQRLTNNNPIPTTSSAPVMRILPSTKPAGVAKVEVNSTKLRPLSPPPAPASLTTFAPVSLTSPAPTSLTSPASASQLHLLQLLGFLLLPPASASSSSTNSSIRTSTDPSFSTLHSAGPALFHHHDQSKSAASFRHPGVLSQ